MQNCAELAEGARQARHGARGPGPGPGGKAGPAEPGWSQAKERFCRRLLRTCVAMSLTPVWSSR